MEQMKLLTEWEYTPAKLNKGYTRQFLSVDLGKADGAHAVVDTAGPEPPQM